MPDDNTFLNDTVLSDKTFHAESIGITNYTTASDSIYLDKRVISYSVDPIPDVSNKQIIQSTVDMHLYPGKKKITI